MKTLLSLVAIMATVTVNAATLSWSMSQIQDMNTGANATGYSAYLFVTQQSRDFGAKTTTVSEITSLVESNGDLTDYIAATKTTNNGMVSGATGYNGSNFTTGDSLTAFVVIFNAATYSTATHYMVSGPVNQVTWGSPTGQKMLAFGSQAGKTWTPVPEPSTAALAFAGLALLLKRRRA